MTKTEKHPALRLIDKQRKQVQKLIRACEGMTREEANDAFACVLPTLRCEPSETQIAAAKAAERILQRHGVKEPNADDRDHEDSGCQPTGCH